MPGLRRLRFPANLTASLLPVPPHTERVASTRLHSRFALKRHATSASLRLSLLNAYRVPAPLRICPSATTAKTQPFPAPQRPRLPTTRLHDKAPRLCSTAIRPTVGDWEPQFASSRAQTPLPPRQATHHSRSVPAAQRPGDGHATSAQPSRFPHSTAGQMPVTTQSRPKQRRGPPASSSGHQCAHRRAG